MLVLKQTQKRAFRSCYIEAFLVVGKGFVDIVFALVKRFSHFLVDDHELLGGNFDDLRNGESLCLIQVFLKNLDSIPSVVQPVVAPSLP